MKNESDTAAESVTGLAADLNSFKTGSSQSALPGLPDITKNPRQPPAAETDYGIPPELLK